jgi:hypothetical protein
MQELRGFGFAVVSELHPPNAHGFESMGFVPKHIFLKAPAIGRDFCDG